MPPNNPCGLTAAGTMAMVPAAKPSTSGHVEGGLQKDTPYKGKRCPTRWDRLRLGAMGLVALSLLFAVCDEALDHNWGYDSPAQQGNQGQVEEGGPQGTVPQWNWLKHQLVKVEGAVQAQMERIAQRLELAELRMALYEQGLEDAQGDDFKGTASARKMLAGLNAKKEARVEASRGRGRRRAKCDSMSCELRRIAQYRERLTPPDEPLAEFPHLVLQGNSPPVEVVRELSRIYFLEALPDRCAGVAHKRYSLTCAAAEAKALGRQLAVHMTTCLSANHTGRELNQWVPTAAYFDLAGIAKNQGMQLVYVEQLISAMQHAEYVSDAGTGTGTGAGVQGGKRGKGGKRGEGLMRVFPRGTPSEALAERAGSTPVVVRHLEVSENGFDVCYASANKHLLPLDPGSIPFNPHLTRIAERIVELMGGRTNFTAVHVRRGDKAKDHVQWPNLDRDTSPDRLKETLPRFAPPRTSLYIATNEEDPRFFDALKGLYPVFRMDDFQHLWGPGSEWLAAYQAMLNTTEPELDVYMRGIIDGHIVWLAHQRVETFNDLTTDPRNGVLEDRPKG